MADDNNQNPSTNNPSDILSVLLNNNNTELDRQNQLLSSIDLTLKKLLQNGGNMSMSNLNNMRGQDTRSTTFTQRYNDRTASTTSSFFGSRGISNAFESFTDELERELLNGLLGSDLNGLLKSAFNRLADDIGVNIQDIPKVLGSTLGKKILSSGVGKDVADLVKGKAGSIIGDIKSKYQQGIDDYYARNPGAIRPTHNPSQSNIRDRLGENNGSGALGTNPSNSSSSGFSANEVIIHASSVTIYLDGPDSNPNDGLPNTGGTDNPDQSNDMNARLRQMLTDSLGEDIAGSIQDAGLNQLTGLLQGGAGSGEVESQLLSLLGGSGGGFDLAGLSQSLVSTLGMGEAGAAGAGASAAGASAALSGLTAAATAAAPVILAVVAGFIALKAISNAIKPAIEGFKTAIDGAKKAANRYSASQKANIDNAQKRLMDDVETMVKTPFDILEKAATEWYNTWDENLRKINGTQGYNKEELQSLMGAFADRLREEGLTSVVSAADITDNLAKVLDSGLSGTVAEEFAYIATKLNAAVPTQDFFGYADTYASIAANSIRMGKSQEQAIAEANAQLEAFASNVLYASREVAGGFTTGLKDAESLFKQSVQIAQAGKTNNATEISAVMTAVSAITGAIAPDLATSMTDAIYKAATGGNSSEIVALRSLAGINASNTEFLRQLASNPKEVFSNLFNELAKRQSMSEDAYMEVAEGLSSIFGVSMDAFARVDFAYLAQAISSMNSSNASLDENIALLASGETTTTAEQLKMQQINKVILDEGLAYVLDNEAARSIQEHMWAEQIAREQMEATYGVELQGAALKFLEGIRETIDNILNFLIPFRALGKVADLASTVAEGEAQKADIAQMLELGKVGTGNANDLYNLTTRNKDLNLTDSLVAMMGGVSAYEIASNSRKLRNSLFFHTSTPGAAASDLLHRTYSSAATAGITNTFSGKSAYGWGTIGKSVASTLLSSNNNGAGFTFAKLSSSTGLDAIDGTISKIKTQELKDALNSMSDFVKNDTEHKYSYDDWVKSVMNKYNIADFNKMLEENNMTAESVEGQFDMLQSQVAAQEKLDREKREEEFWENNTLLLTSTTELITESNDWLESINTHAENTLVKLEEFFESWQDYYIRHTVYNSGFTTDEYDKIVREEKDKSDTAALALAEALTKNNVAALVDPTLQTNVLLAEILKTAVAILAQSKEGGAAISLPDTIAGLSLGIVNI